METGGVLLKGTMSSGQQLKYLALGYIGARRCFAPCLIAELTSDLSGAKAQSN